MELGYHQLNYGTTNGIRVQPLELRYHQWNLGTAKSSFLSGVIVGVQRAWYYTSLVFYIRLMTLILQLDMNLEI